MGKKGKDKQKEGGSATVTKSFDSELDALFKGAGAEAGTALPKESAEAASSSSSKDAKEDIDDEEDEELSSVDSNTVISGISEDESDIGQEDAPPVEVEGRTQEDIDGESDSDSDDGIIPIHETISNPSLLPNEVRRPAKRKMVDRQEPQSQKDTRSLFIGNLPVHLLTSKTSLKALRKHLTACSPYPTVTEIESIRFRSIPFSKPTDDYEAQNPVEAEEGNKKRQRSQSYKDSLNESSKKTFLTGSQKRKVAFINQDINEKADSVNAYITLSPISTTSIAQLNSEKNKDVSSLTAPALAALLAVSVNGTLFEDRHLRADLVVPLIPSDILETGLTTIKTADGSLIGASAGATSIDHESRKRTIFVGNLDFEAKEEELRGFFESLVTRERGSPPDVKALDFSQSVKLPLPEEQIGDGEEEVKRLPSWVYGVRIIRDAATQMGKGFGYVRFLDAASVDEIMAIHESEQNALTAYKAGKSVNQDFRRKLKFKGRALRISRCKVSKGNVTSHAAIATPNRAIINVPQRSRSSGAPTPGGTSPFIRKQQQSVNLESPTRKSKSGIDKITPKSITPNMPNPKPLHSDPLKTARNALKRGDIQRQARRMEKKNKKRAERTTEMDRGDRTKIKLRMGKNGNKFNKARRVGKLAMLSVVAVISLLAQSAKANNENVNFGPIYCRAEEIGHLEDKAARQVSRGWPILTPLSKPVLFSLNPSTQKNGVWLILDLVGESANEELSSKSTPKSPATEEFPLISRIQSATVDNKELTPRDRWIQRQLNHFIWILFTKRFSLRVNYAPNFAIDVDARVYSARSMLKTGNISWKTEDQEKDMETIQQEEELSGMDVPMWPCPRLYVHIVAKEYGVVIPPQQDTFQNRSLFWRFIFKASEAYIGPLMNKVEDIQATAMTPIPVHVVFEPLYLGLIPQTALTLLMVLIPLLLFAFFFVVPPISAAFQSLATKDHIKVD